jgi:hypothetical protein
VIIYKPENLVFKTRLEAKLYLGTHAFNKMMKSKDDRLIVINDNSNASFELQKNNRHYPTETEAEGSLHLSGVSL